MKTPDDHPEKKATGGLNGAWLAIGIGTGTALGVALHQVALGVALGAAFGITLGLVQAKRDAGKR